MGYVFSGDDQRDFSMSQLAWPAVLAIACAHGWEPMGTLHGGIEELGGKPEEWKGSYVGNCGQEVTADDAYALGRAIRTALKDKSYESSSDLCDECVALVQDPIGRERLAQFAEFCMSTGFYIS